MFFLFFNHVCEELFRQTIPKVTWYNSVGCEAYSTVLVETIVEKELGISIGTSIHSGNYCKKLMCFSSMNVESIDDVKIVSYHWEEIKGPLREQKASADTPVLHLSNLVPGNYTFRYLHDDFLGGLSVVSAQCLGFFCAHMYLLKQKA